MVNQIFKMGTSRSYFGPRTTPRQVTFQLIL